MWSCPFLSVDEEVPLWSSSCRSERCTCRSVVWSRHIVYARYIFKTQVVLGRTVVAIRLDTPVEIGIFFHTASRHPTSSDLWPYFHCEKTWILTRACHNIAGEVSTISFNHAKGEFCIKHSSAEAMHDIIIQGKQPPRLQVDFSLNLLLLYYLVMVRRRCWA